MDKLLDNVFKSMQISISQQDSRAINDTAIIIRDLLNSRYGTNIPEEEILMGIYNFTKTIKQGIIAYLKNGDSKAAKSMTDSLLILEKYITHFDSNKVSNTYKGEKLLTVSTDNSVLIGLYDNDKNRGIGKSTSLVKLAHELEVTLITDSDRSKRYLDDIARQLCIPVEVRYASTPNAVRGIRCKNRKFLVDEHVDKGVIDVLIDNKNELIGGFINLQKQNNNTHVIKKYLENELKVIKEKFDVNAYLDYTWGNSYAGQKLKMEHQVIESLLKKLN